ncbi:Ion transport protein-domain-containing protein [Lactifluus volemus]|nr:Ion transport protein-domain-containing protein [Lactifluus volemus]
MDGAHNEARTSTSSAVELVLPSVIPGSPSLSPSSDIPNGSARRRLSWGRVNPGQDPLRLDTPPTTVMNDPLLSSSGLDHPPQPVSPYAIDDNPFVANSDDPFHPSTTPDYAAQNFAYSNNPRAGTSTTSLIPSRRRSSVSTFDDAAHLTANISADPTDDINWQADSEHVAAATPRTRRHTSRYSVGLSPRQYTGAAIEKFSQSLRRVSLRVVNFAGVGLDDHMRLPDDGSATGRNRDPVTGDDDEMGKSEESLLDNSTNVLPLRGRTLGLFGPTNRLRLATFNFLISWWTEPVILCSILFYAVLLTIQASRTLTLSSPNASPPRIACSPNFITLRLLTCATALKLSHECVPISAVFSSLLMRNSGRHMTATPIVRPAPMTSTNLRRKGTFFHSLQSYYDNATQPFSISHSTGYVPSSLGSTSSTASTATLIGPTSQGRKRPDAPSILEKTASSSTIVTAYSTQRHETLTLPFQFSMNLARDITRRNLPYLRHSWTRIDALSVIAFWIAFILAQTGLERGTHHIGLFRALSVLRTARLLTITTGTTTIIHSLKTARSMLAGVAIIGVQTFSGSLARSCYLEPTLGEPETQLSQQCGGYVDPQNFSVMPYITSVQNGHIVKPKGFICPLGQVCKEVQGHNPQGNIQSFDTIYHSALQVFIVASANGWSPLMYAMMDSEFFICCVFFIVCIVVLNFWLINLFVAVITNTFYAIRQVSRKSAFSAAPMSMDNWYRRSPWYGTKEPRPGAVRAHSVVLDSSRSRVARPSCHARWGHWSDPREILNIGELVLTIAFDIEIVIRFVAHLPDWRGFFIQGHNYFDFALAIGSTIIQIPVIHNSPVYPWLTIFQLARFYRLLRGDVQSTQSMNFGQIFTSFLAIYQIFSSENWTTVLYSSDKRRNPWGIIVLQMFIAVINENFSIAEEAKRSQQANYYFQTQEPDTNRAAWIHKLNPYRWLKPSPRAIAVESLPSNLVLPMQKSLVQDYGIPERRPTYSRTARSGKGSTCHNKSLNLLQRLFVGDTPSDDVPLATLRHARMQSSTQQNPTDEETERHLDLLVAINNEGAGTQDTDDALDERKAMKADFIRDHPSYDKTSGCFHRRMQYAGGERIFGRPPSPVAHTVFQLVLLVTVIGGIVVESVATPMYRHSYYASTGTCVDPGLTLQNPRLGHPHGGVHHQDRRRWLLFTPNAYVRSIWNILDFFIMAGLLVNVTVGLIFISGLSRFTRALKALRALKLITLIEKMRSTFETLIISGFIRILDAALLAMLYMIPYANNVVTSSNTAPAFAFPVPRVWANPAPSTTFSFDSFRSSLLILFEIVSLEGWIDAMGVVTSITGPDQQPQTNASQFNAIFFVIYNMLGGVVILTLFVSIIIGNFTAKKGTALLTQPQREWVDLQKLITRQRPSERPKTRPTQRFRAWCFDCAVRKHGWWARVMTVLFTFHIMALMTQTFAPHTLSNDVRNDFFLFVTVMYVVDISVRLYGLGWRSFRANGWNIFDVFVATGTLLTTISHCAQVGPADEQLNKLFKTAVMTKWGSAENHNQNYSTMGKALVMLSFMTTGEGWNQYMHDLCTNSIPNDLDSDSDCGSTGWAYTLFIAWNILSMYIFANMFTVHGRHESSNERRDESFQEDLGRVCKSKDWIFGAFAIRPLFQNPDKSDTGSTYGVNVESLNATLSRVDDGAIRRRRQLFSGLYHEAILTHQRGKGISFTDMLILLAHYKLIVDKDALVLKDLVMRTETNELVNDLVNLDRVRSLLKCKADRRRLLVMREEARGSTANHEVPEIVVVEDIPSTPPPLPRSRDITSAGHHASRLSWVEPETPTRRDQFDISDFTPIGDSGPSTHASRGYDVIVGKATRSLSVLREFSADVHGSDALASMQSSSWGAMMHEAEEEEEQEQ